MKYSCKIVDIIDDEITVKIDNFYITGFTNCGVSKKIGDEAVVDILLYDDLSIFQSDEHTSLIMRKGNSFAYSLFGILDVDNAVLKSSIDFEIDKEELFNFGYLDGKKVKVDVIRIDFDFVE